MPRLAHAFRTFCQLGLRRQAQYSFMPPMAWRYTVLIALDRMPTRGEIAVGADDVRQVTYDTTPARTPATRSRAKSRM